MKLFSGLLASGILLVGCRADLPQNKNRDDQSWLVQSRDSGVFTIQREGPTYKAVCDGATVFVNGHGTAYAADGSVAPLSNIDNGYKGTPPRCERTIDLVGRSIENYDPASLPAAGKRVDPEGFVTTIAQGEGSLMLRRWHDVDTHSEEMLKITSVAQTSR